MKRNITISLLLSSILAFSALTGCGGSSPAPAANDGGGEVVINYPSFQIGVNSAAPYTAKAIENFNNEYAGKIKIVVEEIPGDQDYVDKMKILLSSGELPGIIYTGGYNILDDALAKNLVADLTPYIDADPAWKASQPQAIWDFNSRDGKIYAASDETTLMGYFYNKELFEKAGVTPAKTWDEFFANCDKLKAAGITPLSMDTFDSGWLTSLWMSAILGSQNEAGLKMVTDYNIKDYNTPEFIDTMTKIQKMFMEYTTPDAVGGKYENGANNFLSEQTAMIANGPWMINDFVDAGIIDKVGIALYPEQGIFDAPNPGFFVTVQDKAQQDACVEFVKYMTNAKSQALALDMIQRVPTATTVEIPESIKADMPLLAELLDYRADAKHVFNNFQAIWYPNVVDGLSSYYPELAQGTITPEQFAQNLTDLAAKN